MDFSLIILQPFLLIALGFVLSKHRLFPKSLWSGVEVLVYYVLFPPLLFNSVANAKLVFTETSVFLFCGLASMFVAVFLSWLVSKIAPVDSVADASLRQCGYRFNSFIGFAIVLALYGQTGMALFALLVGVWVPICNSIAVADLATATRKEGQGLRVIIKSILRNPLILATLAGLTFNVLGLAMPNMVTALFKSLGSASLVLALMAIGSGLKVQEFQAHKMMMALASLQRLIWVPAVSFVLGRLLGLDSVEMGALLCFTVLPTANSCYILAVRMGGNGSLVANLTTLQTILSIATIPCWLWLLQN